jgi:hypothetical protein
MEWRGEVTGEIIAENAKVSVALSLRGGKWREFGQVESHSSLNRALQEVSNREAGRMGENVTSRSAFATLA